MNIKVGDKIKVRKDLEIGTYGKVDCNEIMVWYLADAEVTVKHVFSDGTMDVDSCNGYHYWISPEMIAESYKSTRYTNLMSMSVEEVAMNNVRFHNMLQMYFTSDGTPFDKENYKEALEHEIAWWNDEV